MCPIFDFKCLNPSCEQQVEANVASDTQVTCEECGSPMQKLLSFAGYTIHGKNGASTRPKSAGAFAGRKK